METFQEKELQAIRSAIGTAINATFEALGIERDTFRSTQSFDGNRPIGKPILHHNILFQNEQQRDAALAFLKPLVKSRYDEKVTLSAEKIKGHFGYALNFTIHGPHVTTHHEAYSALRGLASTAWREMRAKGKGESTPSR